MLTLSTKGEYGVRAMLEIAREYEKGPISIMEIARRQGVSVAYLEQLLNRLKRAELIRSYRGPGGGYVLIRKPDEISIRTILEALEGPVALTMCLDPTSEKRRCSLVKKCVAKLLWQSLGKKIEDFLNGITLDDLLNEEKRLKRSR